jgi:hypothetical protein
VGHLGGRSLLDGVIGGVTVVCLLDTGAEHSCVARRVIREVVGVKVEPVSPPKTVMVTGGSISK